ncbi:MAG TPA: glycosyl hydrolase 53 family protein [Verrucomicrobiae bacterium]|nr:glycosyl hydrolase 53 family protein [Verrucomicrobiae bacterium]
MRDHSIVTNVFKLKLACLLFVVSALFAPGTVPAQGNFIAGADMSFLAYYESLGIVYKDNGVTEDALQILKTNGINCIRLRLFTSSAAQAAANPYNYINNTNYTIPLAVRVKNAGLQFLLDFHYSDTWADPSHQATPAAWLTNTFPQMVQQMYTYNSNTVAAFAAAGATPDYVQIGNEITQGMLFTNSAGATIGQVSGSYNTSWSQLGQLMKAAVQGIQDAANAAGVAMPKIIVHIDRGGDWATTEWFFDNLTYQGVPFDIIGESYYPFWHGPLSGLSNCLTNAAQRYGKPVIVAETDFPWTSSTNIYGIPATTNGQVQYVVALAQVVKSVPNNLGAGIFWWGTEYQYPNANQAGFGTRSFFGSDGNVLPVADAYGQLAVPIVLSAGLSGSNLVMQWPLSGAGMNLMMTTDLAPPTVWLPVANAIQNTGTVFDVSLPMNPTQSRFYRLQSN